MTGERNGANKEQLVLGLRRLSRVFRMRVLLLARSILLAMNKNTFVKFLRPLVMVSYIHDSRQTVEVFKALEGFMSDMLCDRGKHN